MRGDDGGAEVEEVVGREVVTDGGSERFDSRGAEEGRVSGDDEGLEEGEQGGGETARRGVAEGEMLLLFRRLSLPDSEVGDVGNGTPSARSAMVSNTKSRRKRTREYRTRADRRECKR